MHLTYYFLQQFCLGMESAFRFFTTTYYGLIPLVIGVALGMLEAHPRRQE